MAEATPRPQFGTGNESANNRVAVNIAQFFNALGFSPDIEVVIPRLPERSTLDLTQLAGDILLQHLQR